MDMDHEHIEQLDDVEDMDDAKTVLDNEDAGESNTKG